MAQAWADVLPYQSLEWQRPEPDRPANKPPQLQQGYVNLTVAGGWPDITTAYRVRDARAERLSAHALENRTGLTTSPLADRDGYTGTIPPGAGLILPAVAQPEAPKGAQADGKGKRRNGKPGRIRSWVQVARTQNSG